MTRGDIFFSSFPTKLREKEVDTSVIPPGLTNTFPPDNFDIIGHHIINPTGSGGNLRATIVVVAREILSAPAAPTDLVAVTGASSGEVDLVWNAPSNAGGSAITDYFIEFSNDNFISDVNTFVHTPSTTPSITVTGLTPGATFFFRVSAINSIGTGPPSDIASADAG